MKSYSVYKEAEELINIGADVQGSNPEIDYAIEKIGPMNDFLTQDISEVASLDESLNQLKGLF